MAQSTVPDELPYPESPDTPDVPRDIQALAEKVQLALLNRDAAFQDQILYGPVDQVPATLQPGQLYCGY